MRKGFTIIELMVAVALFVVVVGIASATFVQSLRTQRQVVALMVANDNASLILEQMAREIRFGRAFSASSDRLTFTNFRGDPVIYELEEGTIKRTVGGTSRPLTATNVKVHYLNFDPQGEAVGDRLATRITINLGVSARGALEDFITRLQTTISARTLDS